MVMYADRMQRFSGSAIREIMKLMADPEMISFGGGSPSKETFPVDIIQEITHDLLAAHGQELLQYGVTEGWQPLRQAAVEHLVVPKGVKAAQDQMIITTGATQAIELAVEVFINQGDTVLVESPTFVTTLMVLHKFGANCVAVETDEHGLVMADLEEKMKQYHPKLLYCIPTFQNPTGRTLPADRRQRIAELAATYDVMVLEDDPYCELRYQGEALPPIKAFDTEEKVILVNSFSKIISPGLRVGTVTAAKEILAKMTVAKQCTDTHSSLLSQAICAEFLNRGLLLEHLQKIREIYAVRLAAMLDGIARYFPQGTKYNCPEGGLFVWVELPGDVDTDALLPIATQAYKVAFVPGSSFYLKPEDGKRMARLNFSASSLEQIEIGLQRLGELFSKAVAGN